ncbi:MAG: hypothetical protein M3378_10405 [Actinomycetota bacterium]|nr:hypothetical protein [Actinomycetota bacterium]
MKVIAWLAGLGTLLASGAYMVVSLNRWEWNRALFFGLILLMAEVGLGVALVLRRLARLEGRGAMDPAVAEILRETRSVSPNRFEWLKEPGRDLNVFITFLVGGGMIISAVAWVVDRVASKTATAEAEHRLARQLAPISHPRGGLVVDDVTVLAQEVPGADDAQIRKLLRRAGHG